MDSNEGLQARVIAALIGLPELHNDVWVGLNTARRLEVLQEAERLIAVVMGRAVCDVRSYDSEPDEPGYFDGHENAIFIASDSLEREGAPENVATLVHEARHAYQSWCVNHPGVHPDAAEVEAWRRNISNYVDPTFDERAYFARMSAHRHECACEVAIRSRPPVVVTSSPVRPPPLLMCTVRSG